MRIALAVILAPVAAHADPSVHAGLNLRVDSGAHPIRVVGGADLGNVDLSLTLDPMVVTDGQFDADAMSLWKLCDSGWGVLAGWRTTAIGIQGGRQFQEKLVVGVGAPLPRLGPIRSRFGFELATVVVKHGGGLPTEWISFSQGRDFVDLINFGMFVTVEYATR
jgi:hypothetical protein